MQASAGGHALNLKGVKVPLKLLNLKIAVSQELLFDALRF